MKHCKLHRVSREFLDAGEKRFQTTMQVLFRATQGVADDSVNMNIIITAVGSLCVVLIITAIFIRVKFKRDRSNDSNLMIDNKHTSYYGKC